MALIHQQEPALKLTCLLLSVVLDVWGLLGCHAGEENLFFFSSLFLGRGFMEGGGGKTTELLRLPYLCLILNAIFSNNYTGFA